MPYFKDLQDGLHFLSEADILAGGEGFLPDGSVAISDSEASIIQAGMVSLPSAKDQALAALASADIVAIRCFKAGISFPAAWANYCVSLRTIVSSNTGALPTHPAYPEGS